MISYDVTMMMSLYSGVSEPLLLSVRPMSVFASSAVAPKMFLLRVVTVVIVHGRNLKVPRTAG